MLGSLKDVKEINGKPILHLNGVSEDDAPISQIIVNHEMDRISFDMLTKPASEGGDMSRCQLVDLIHTAKIMLEYLNDEFPCRENAITITKLEEALMWQDARAKDRIARNVEGKNSK